MTNTIEKSFTVCGKNATVIYDLTFYSEKDYKKDFKDFLNYQTRKVKFSAPDDADWKFYNLKEHPFISYEDFLKIISELVSKIVLYRQSRICCF